ncbi:hypothetical protein GGR55DRAFT_406255 [Xylaria sp. FL0064]|nr:hypothetical protein GGR55DRAFT_406255 [Xylaria sp. FL0064]
MASPVGFSRFDELPFELRILVWEMSILDHHRDRLIPLNECTKRIICNRTLVCSSHFSTTKESCQVATGLHPIRLPVLQMMGDWAIRAVADRPAFDKASFSSKGAIYINPDLDIFIFKIERLLSPDDSLTRAEGNGSILGCLENFGWRTPGLSSSQCQSVRRVMLFGQVTRPIWGEDERDNDLRRPYPENECRRTPEQYVIQYALLSIIFHPALGSTVDINRMLFDITTTSNTARTRQMEMD